MIADRQEHRKFPEKQVQSATLATGLLELIVVKSPRSIKVVESLLTCCLVKYGHSCAKSSSGMSALLPDMYLAVWPGQTGSNR